MGPRMTGRKHIKVQFVGEKGIAIGGLKREFLSLLFTNEGLFEHNGFHHDSDLMKKKTFFILGRATATALLSGHPGPQCFNRYISEYICSGLVPDLSDISDTNIGRADVVSAIQKVTH